MKTVVFALLLAVGVAACDSEAPQTQEPFQNPYAYVGEHHNRALDQTLEAMVDTKPTSFEDAQGQIEPLVISYMETNGFTTGLSEGQMRGFVRTGLYPQASRSFGTADTALTDAQNSYIARINDILNSDTTASDVASALDALNLEVSTALTADDAATVLIVSAVASSSASYWYAHLDEWEARYGEAGTRPAARGISAKLPPSWQQVARADAGGALAGALASLWTGCAEASMGACAALAAMGGSVGNSAAEFFR